MADSTEKVKVVIEGDSRSVVDALTKFKGASESASKSSASFMSSLTSINSAFELAKKGAEAAGKAFDFIAKNGATETFNRNLSEINKSASTLQRSIAESVTQSASFNQAMVEISGALKDADRWAKDLGVTVGDSLATGLLVARAVIVDSTVAIHKMAEAYGVARIAGNLWLAVSDPSRVVTHLANASIAYADLQKKISDNTKIEAEAQARLEENIARVQAMMGKNLGSRSAKPLNEVEKDASKSAEEKAKKIAEEEKKIREEYAKTASAEAEMLYDSRRLAADAAKDKMELVNIEREQTLDKLRSQGMTEVQLYETKSSFSRKFAATYLEIETERIKKTYKDEQDAHNLRMELAKKFIDTRSKDIAREFKEREEAQQKIAQGINNFSAIASAAFQAGHVWAEAFKAGAKPRDIARGIFSTLSLGLGVAGMIAGGPTNPLGSGLLMGGVLTGGVGGFFHGGGMVGPTGVPMRAHGGLSPPLAGERDIRARVGEGVLSGVGVQAVGGPRGVERANRGESPSSAFTFAPVINVSPGIGASDVKMILDREITTHQSGFMRELRRTGAVRQGAR